MKGIAFALTALSPAIICSVFAGLLALSGRSGWGWFLFVALVMFGSVKVSVE